MSSLIPIIDRSNLGMRRDLSHPPSSSPTDAPLCWNIHIPPVPGKIEIMKAIPPVPAQIVIMEVHLETIKWSSTGGTPPPSSSPTNAHLC